MLKIDGGGSGPLPPMPAAGPAAALPPPPAANPEQPSISPGGQHQAAERARQGMHPAAHRARQQAQIHQHKSSGLFGAIGSFFGGVAHQAGNVVSHVQQAADHAVNAAEGGLDHGIDWAEQRVAQQNRSLVEQFGKVPVLGGVVRAEAWVSDQNIQLLGGVVKGAGTLVGGVAGMAVHPLQTVKGLFALGEHIPMIPVNPLRLVTAGYDIATHKASPLQALNQAVNPVEVLKDDASFGKALVKGITAPYQAEIKQGKYSEAVGRGLFDVGSLILTAGAGDAVVGAADGTRAAEIAADATRATAVASDAGKVSKLGEAGRAGEVADAGRAGEVADASRAARALKTKGLEPQYAGEQLPGNHIWGTQVKYLSATEREAYRLTIKDGKLYDATGHLFDTAKAGSVHSADPRAIFVMDRNGNIFASLQQKVGAFHHSSLLAGDEVSAAGELSVRKGVLELISNKSGHYRPPAELTQQTLQVLKDRGVDVSHVKLDYL